MKILLTVLLSSLLFISLYAQEWDEISDEELAKTDFPEYPEAEAVILFDIGKLKITSDFDLEIQQHVRIKILTEEGKEHADISFPFRDYDDIVDLEAHAYSPDGEEYELDEDDIHYQKYDDWSMCRFSIPGVEVGSVIEYQYRILREYIHFLDPWYFQNKIYTVLSQLTVSLKPGFNYTAFPSNVRMYDYKLDQEDYWDIDTKKQHRRFTWSARNLPPLKREKLMYNIDDYLAKVYFQLVSYKDQYQNYTFIKSWDDLARQIYKSFDEPINMDSGLEDYCLNLIADCNDDKNKIKRIHAFVIDSIETIDDMDLWDFKQPDQVLESRSGNPSSKNLLLINMLNHAGIKSDPVMISTRRHGRLRTELPQLNQFNHFLVLVSMNNKDIFLDASDEFCPMGVLDTDCAVPSGLLVKEESGQIIKINAKKVKSMTQVTSDITLKSGGEITARSTLRLSGYHAFRAKGKIKSKSLEEYGEDRLQDCFEEYLLDSIWIEDQDDPENLICHMNYQVRNFAEDGGDMLYLPLPMLTKRTTNPLKSEYRNYPVDYPNTYNELETVNIHLGENMKIVELPIKQKDESRYAAFSSFVFKGKQKVELNRHFAIKKNSYQPSEYRELRRVYNSMINSDQNQIVISVN